MKTRIQILGAKSYGKRCKKQHLAELNALIKVPIQEENFMSVEDTDTFMNIRLMYVSRLKKTTPFSDKHILCSVIDCIANHYKDSVLFFSYYSEYCGMYVLNTIADFNCNFGFHDEHSGLISLQTSDNSNRLVIDFYEEYNEYLLDIVVYGDLWCSIVSDILA